MMRQTAKTSGPTARAQDLDRGGARMPGVKIVLNQFRGPFGGLAPISATRCSLAGARDIERLSTCPNMYVKLGGLAMIVNAVDFHLAPLPLSSGEMAMPGGPMSTPV